MKLRDFLGIDYVLLFAAITLTVFGILFIYSSGISSAGVQNSGGSPEYIRQIIWAVAGLIIALVIAMIDYKRLYDVSAYLYAGTLILLVYTCLFGRPVHGARAWIGIGPFGIQPSEFAKITTILFLARYLDSSKRGRSFTRLITSSIIVLIPMGLVLIQPDFGTSLVFIPILLVMTFIAGVSIRYILFIIACIAGTAILMTLPLWQTFIAHSGSLSLNILLNIRFVGIAIAALTLILLIALYGLTRYKKRYFYWICYSAAVAIFSLGASFASHKVLKDYQLKRLIVFLDPNVDPQGSGWHIIQSITAIGSGGLWGKGYLQGTQSHYRFLPEQSTDFIFSIFSEEWGFIGGIIAFGLFLLISLRLIKIMQTTTDSFGTFITAGLSAIYSFHFLINVGMTMGIMPVTGIPLLFMSYGGSAITAAMAGIGFAMSVHMRRHRR